LRPQLADLSELGALTSSDAPASLEAMAALSPDLVLDYGDAGPAMRDLADGLTRGLGLFLTERQDTTARGINPTPVKRGTKRA
jgi:hypothetical protein